MENPIISLINEHRSIRKFKDKPLSQKHVDQLVTAAQHASTSTFSQQYSIISITDPNILKEIGLVTTRNWMENSGHYFVIVADQNRNFQIAKAKGIDTKMLNSTDKFLASVFDASVAVQNMVIAAESMGLGVTIMGSVLNDATHIVDVLHLPKLTFPLLGLAVGYPAEIPDSKPRMPKSMMYFQNQYQLPTDFDKQLKDYDELVKSYYEERNSNVKKQTFTDHVVKELTTKMERPEILKAIHQQNLMLD